MQTPLPTIPPGAATPPAAAPQVFGLLIPGRPVRTDFAPVDATNTKFALTLLTEDGNPITIADVVFFLLPGITLPPDHGAVLYWNVQGINSVGSSGFQTLGAIGPNRPSGVFRTAWANNDVILDAVGRSNGQPVSVTLGVSVEPLGNIANLEIATKGVEDRVQTAKQIAMDLFNYLQSFDFNTYNDGMMVPRNIFERWMKRFEAKSRVDPNFFMKSSE
jgi:hypothetical protein